MASQSDLIPEYIALGSTSVAPGGSLFVNWLLDNQGAAAANSSSTTVVRINQSSSNASGTNLAYVSTSALSAYTWQYESTYLTVPTTPGTYYVWVIADDYNSVTNQSNTSNDLQHSVAFTVTAPTLYSDLLPENLSLGASSVTVGGSLPVYWTMLNQGQGSAPATTTGIRITTSSTNYGGPSNTVADVSTLALAAGASDAQSDTITVPTADGPGTYYVWVVADNSNPGTGNQGPNTGNDYQLAGSFTVTTPTLYSDLLPENLSLGALSVTVGGSLPVYWTMLNQGQGSAPATTTGIRITTSSTNYGGPSNTVADVSTPALATGASDAQSDTITVPTADGPGTYYVWVVADNSNPGTGNQGPNTGNDYQLAGSFSVVGSGNQPVAGFDTEFFPGESLMSTIYISTNLKWCGYYLKAPSQNLDTGWLGERSYLEGLGWKIAPLYVGAQDPALGGDNTFVSQTDPTSEGVSDAEQALLEMGPDTGATQIVLDQDSSGNWTIKKTVDQGQGFAPGTIVYLDWENAPISQGPNTDYIVAWCKTIADSGTYVPGIYCKQSDISVILPLVSQYNVQFWSATWDQNTPQTVSVTSSQTQFLNSVPPGGSASATSWQYGSGYDTANGLLNNVDLDTSSLYGSSTLCFCRGTTILTDRGDVPVEALAIGDQVVTATGAVRPIVWIGTGRVLATRGRRNAATPVIVRKGALADNVPRRDLRVTKGHALYLEGALIPVEFLVNHRSIIWDDRAQEVELFHIELETHDVLLADGAPAESYRDDSNRWLFQNANTGWNLPPQQPCASVLTGGPLVDAVWRRLLDRDGARPGLPLTEEPDLHLLVRQRRLDAAVRRGDVYVFNLPAQADTVRIVSRAAVPAELGLARDPRSLGVALRRIVLRQGTRFQAIEAQDERLNEGFHLFEAVNGFRWTDGDAAVPPDLLAGFTGPTELVLRIAATARYRADSAVRQVA